LKLLKIDIFAKQKSIWHTLKNLLKWWYEMRQMPW
jgi:hypothetical protein